MIRYRISSYSFRRNYSVLNFEIQRSQYIRPKVIVHKGGETIQGRKLFKGGNYMRKYGIYLLSVFIFLQFLKCMFFLKSAVMHLNIVARMGIKVAKADAYLNQQSTMVSKTVTMDQTKDKSVSAYFSWIVS